MTDAEARAQNWRDDVIELIRDFYPGQKGAIAREWMLNCADAILALPALSTPTPAGELREVDGLPMSDAPRDGRYILAVVAANRGRYLEHQAGRTFVIRHEGLLDTFDLGWAVYPGFGGCSDFDFDCWFPLPAIRALAQPGSGEGV